MKDVKMYTMIKQLKEKGFSQNAVSKQLGIHRKTVKRYWHVEADEFAEISNNTERHKLLDQYEIIILNWLKEYPDMSASQIEDWLKEHYRADFNSRTVSRYVKMLRTEYSLSKKVEHRSYEAVEELPMGKQIQVDFGEKRMESPKGKKALVRFAAFILSHSRYKYVCFQSRPFTTVDLVNACRQCFSYFGGITQELVFDQDSIVSVSENCGDIIYTYEFEKFRQECKFDIYLCRGADPESKGKVENMVKYVKGNFLDHRFFPGDEILNSCGIDWLERTANTKRHGSTYRVPKDVFALERECLKPLPNTKCFDNSIIIRTVRKDNTILYNCNRYSLPLGTYNSQREVSIEADNEILKIYTEFHDYICEHSISHGKGLLIKNSNHSRDHSKTIDRLQDELNEILNHKASEFLQSVRIEKPRYSRDQFKLIRTLYDIYGLVDLLRAIDFCHENRLYSATYARDFLTHMHEEKQPIALLPIPVSDMKYHVTTEKRPLDVYAKAGGKVEQ